MRVLFLTAAKMVTVVMMTVIMVIPVLINDDDVFSQN